MAHDRLRNGGKLFAAEFGVRLRKARDRRGMTQAQLADSIGAYASQISNYENGEKVPEGETMVALADALDVSLDELARGVPKEGPVEVHDMRLRTSVRQLEAIGSRDLLDVAATTIEGLVALGEAADARNGRRRKR